MSLPSIDGLCTMFLEEELSFSPCWVGVRAIMRSAMDDCSARDLNCFWDIAPVFLQVLEMRCARIFRNIFPRQDSREIGHRFFGTDVSLRPDLGMGTHFASFHLEGKLSRYRTSDKRRGRSSGTSWWVVAIIL